MLQWQVRLYPVFEPYSGHTRRNSYSRISKLHVSGAENPGERNLRPTEVSWPAKCLSSGPNWFAQTWLQIDTLDQPATTKKSANRHPGSISSPSCCVYFAGQVVPIFAVWYTGPVSATSLTLVRWRQFKRRVNTSALLFLWLWCAAFGGISFRAVRKGFQDAFHILARGHGQALDVVAKVLDRAVNRQPLGTRRQLAFTSESVCSSNP